MSSFRVFLDGEAYDNVEQGTVRMSMEAFARDFTLTMGNDWPDGVLPFEEGAAVEVVVDDECVLTGFVDEIPVTYDSTSHTIQVLGRSVHGQMVDCSAVHKTGHWRDQPMLKIASDVAEPFGVTIGIDGDLPNAEKEFRKWAIEDAESAADCVTRLAKMRGGFPVAGPGTGLAITAASMEPPRTDAIAWGRDILRGSRNGRAKERYSHYIVKSQSAGNDYWYGEDAAAKGVYVAVDQEVPQYRPLIIISDSGSAKELEDRAKWERNIRAGRARRVVYDLQGFQRPSGGVWKPNARVAVDDPFTDVSTDLLAIGVTFTYSGEGSVTTLELGASEQFDIRAEPRKRKRRKRGPSFL